MNSPTVLFTGIQEIKSVIDDLIISEGNRQPPSISHQENRRFGVMVEMRGCIKRAERQKYFNKFLRFVSFIKHFN